VGFVVAVAQFFHEFGGRVALVHLQLAAFVRFDEGAGLVLYLVASLIFGGYG
jgi:phage shock protein PspC (stress-responsive transcriptional regulator)